MAAPNLEELARRINACITHDNDIWDHDSGFYGDCCPDEMYAIDMDEEFHFEPDWEGALELMDEVPSGSFLPIVEPPNQFYDYGGSILHIAAANPKVPLKVIQRLIQVLGPDGVRHRTSKAKTSPLHYAFDNLDVNVIVALAEADPDSIHQMDSVAGMTPLERIIENSRFLPASYPMNPAEAVARLLAINPTLPVEERPWLLGTYDYNQYAIKVGAPQAVKNAVRAGWRPAPR